MKRTYSLEEIRDARARIGMAEMTFRAGKAIAEEVLRIAQERGETDVLLCCDGGRYGAYGFSAAQMLHETGFETAVFCPSHLLPETAAVAREYHGEQFSKMPRRLYGFVVMCMREDVCEDAVLPVFASAHFRLACDLPYGLDENGFAQPFAVHAEETLCLGALPSALFMGDGADCSGKITFADLGLSFKEEGVLLYEDADIAPFFPKRPSRMNKGDCGGAQLIGGECYGAAFLAVSGCLHSGAGYTSLCLDRASEEGLLIAASRFPACIVRRERRKSDCTLFGMGAGVSEETYQTVLQLLGEETPLVLDADALNSLARFGVSPLSTKKCAAVLTPHLKEFSRLLGISVEEVRKNAVSLAKEFAVRTGCVIVLKDNRTIISDGKRTAVNGTGSPALAKGGSGDLLSGFLAGTIARGVPMFEAAVLSCFVHGRTGEYAAAQMGEYAPDATDVCAFLPQVLLSLQG